jgi:UDP-glucuronate decarboxylase
MHPVVEEDLRAIAAVDLPWGDLEGRTVVVSGAGGLIAGCLVEALLYRNAHGGGAPTRVVGLERHLDRARERFAGYQGRADLQLVGGDICEPVGVDGPVDYVIHAASQASPKVYSTDPVGTLLANTHGTLNLLRLAQAKEAHGFLFVSAGEVYGQPLDPAAPLREDRFGTLDPTNVRSCYGEGKRAGESLCVSWHHQHGLRTVIPRLFHTYGPGMRLDDGRIFADFVADVLAGRDLVLRSDGSARRVFCYLADAVVGLLTVLLKGAAATAYNLANPAAELSILELAELLVRLFPEKHLAVVRQPRAASDPYMPSPYQRSTADITRIRALGWEPKTEPAAGFLRTVRSYQ